MTHISTTIKLPSGKSLTVPTGLFINNQFVPAVDGSTLETINPATEAVICSVSAGAPTSYYAPLSCTNVRDPTGSEKDIDLAVAAARKAFNTAWGKKVTGAERGRLIYKLADLMERDMQDLAELESLDNGKPIRIARCALFTSWVWSIGLTDFKNSDADIADSIACMRYYAGWADKIQGKVRYLSFCHFPCLTMAQTIEVNDPVKFAFTRHEPVGVCGQM